MNTQNIKVGHGVAVNVDTPCTSFALVRYGSATHTVNTDQRRIPLVPTSSSGTQYEFQLPSDAGIAIPGFYMFFAMNAQGTPSVAWSVRLFI